MLNNLDIIVDQDRNEIIKDIQKLVQINSIQGTAEEGKPFGEGPTKALRQALSLCQKFGFSTVNMDNYVGYAEYGEGEEVLAILVHVDVVPVGSGWTVAPFEVDIRGNLLYGRGAYDDKGGVVASIYALKAVKDAGALFKRRVRIILGANEETGMMDIPYYLKREAQPDMAFSPDSPFPVVYGEKGILDFKVTYKTGEMPHILYFHAGDNIKFTPELCEVSLSVSEKEKAEIIEKLRSFDQYESEYDEVQTGILNIRIRGTRVFAVRPQDGINAATGMIDFLFQIDFLKNEIGDFCSFYLTKFGYSHDGSGIDCDVRDQISTPLTLSPDLFILENSTIIFSVHCRFPVTVNCEKVISKLKNGIAEENVIVSFERVSPAHYIPVDSKLVSSLMEVYRELTGDSAAKPVTMEGGTYARMLKNAVAFGPLFPGEPQVAHSPNEYLNLDSIIKATKIYARSIYKLACDSNDY